MGFGPARWTSAPVPVGSRRTLAVPGPPERYGRHLKEAVMPTFLSTNWIWILLIGGMLLMPRGWLLVNVEHVQDRGCRS